jgi:hypothetical protein
MTETVHRLASLHLKNERTVWILEPFEMASLTPCMRP